MIDVDLQDRLQQQLLRGAAEMSVTLTEEQTQKLLAYIGEFEKWNKAYNLSAVRDIQQMVARHLLDSLSVVPWFSAQETNKKNFFPLARIIDVGTGGGLPGIPLAIMFPQKQFTLLDSNGKKTRFLFHVKTLLGLTNVTVENRRVEEFLPTQKFQGVISRAFASLQDMIEGCSNLIEKDGIFLAMKGVYPEDELLAVKEKVDLLETNKLVVAETDGERHLLVLRCKQ